MCSVNVCMVCHGQSVQFPSQVALSRVDVGTTSAHSLCAHISRWWGMCVRKVYDIFTSFFFRPLSYFTKVRFPCYFLPSPLTIGGGVSWAEMLHQHVCCSRHSFLLMSVEETGVEWMGWRGTVALSFSLSPYQALSFIRHPSLPPPRVPHFVVPFLPSTALQMSLVFLSSVYFLLLQQCCRCTLG